MKKIAVWILLFSFLAMTTGCSVKTSNSQVDDKLTIVTTLFPQYDFVKQIVGDKAEVVLLLPPGMESHAYEPTPQDIITIQKSNLFVYTGEFMEPWAHKVLESFESDTLVIVDASNEISLLDEEEHEDEDEHEDDEEEHGGKDPHIWLDPLNAQIMVDNILKGLIEADPTNEDFYKENALNYKQQLKELDEQFLEVFSNTKYNKIIYGGHFAFGYFAKRYGLEHISPYNGFSPDSEPTPSKIAALVDTMNTSGIKVIYYEELIDPKVARVIADETSAEMLMLHGAHNISKDELEQGITYLSIMQENMEKLKDGLGYDE